MQAQICQNSTVGNLLNLQNYNMRLRISELRKEKGLKLEELSERSGISISVLSRLQTGDKRFNSDHLEALARGLDVPIARLFSDEQSTSDESVAVRGAVQAGAFLDANEWDTDSCYHVSVPISDKWKPYRKFGLEVRGPSMNRRYPEKTVLVCVGLLDADIEPTVGHRYIVQSERSGEYETTVKELRVDDEGHPWLWPDSDHPDHQSPLQINGNDGDTVQIIAIVIASAQPE